MNKATWVKIQQWRDYYNSTPNGWAVAYMIGEEYDSSKNIKKRKKNEERI